MTSDNISKKIKCAVCQKKITMIYIQCRCDEYFCGKHRYANEHKCKYDYKKSQKEIIRKENPIVVKEKFEKI